MPKIKFDVQILTPLWKRDSTNVAFSDNVPSPSELKGKVLNHRDGWAVTYPDNSWTTISNSKAEYLFDNKTHVLYGIDVDKYTLLNPDFLSKICVKSKDNLVSNGLSTHCNASVDKTRNGFKVIDHCLGITFVVANS